MNKSVAKDALAYIIIFILAIPMMILGLTYSLSHTAFVSIGLASAKVCVWAGYPETALEIAKRMKGAGSNEQ